MNSKDITVSMVTNALQKEKTESKTKTQGKNEIKWYIQGIIFLLCIYGTLSNFRLRVPEGSQRSSNPHPTGSQDSLYNAAIQWLSSNCLQSSLLGSSHSFTCKDY